MLMLAAAALALYGSLSMQMRTATLLPLREYLSSFGLDLSQHGTLPYDALLAASVFVLPAFALGTSLRLLSCGRAQAALMLGGSLGMLLTLKVGDFSAAGTDTQTFAMQWMPLAAGLTGAGALLALLSLSSSGSAGRWLQIAFALVCMLPIAMVEISPRAVLAPWSRTPIAPYQLRETPAGLMTVEGPLLPDSITGSTKQLTLERRVLVPGLEFIPDELSMLDASIALLTPESQTQRARRVLLIGQLTPLRARRLKDAGIAAIDRSASWWQAMEALEQEYFGEQAKPAGSILAPGDALKAIEAGQYTLVIVPPVRGIAPQLNVPTLPAQTTLVVWLDSATPLRGGSEPGLLHWAPSKIDQPLLARIFGAHAHQACVLPGGLSSGSPGLGRLMQREWERGTGARADNFRRVRAAQDSALTRGLEQLYAAQQRSSPFENTAESFELPEPALEQLRQAALEGSPSPSLRVLWEELGLVIAGKRWIPQLYEALEPLAKRHAPWPELELQLAIADAESLEFESAAARLRPLRSNFERNPEYWRELGKIQEQLGEAADSVYSFRQALNLRPGDHDLERRLAFQLVRAGDPEGQRLVLELLQEHPDDEELKLFSGSGPYPPPKRGYSPQGRRHDH
jgi:Flp pilus assembly protein TadD